jgi:hypothetical protein
MGSDPNVIAQGLNGPMQTHFKGALLVEVLIFCLVGLLHEFTNAFVSHS